MLFSLPIFRPQADTWLRQLLLRAGRGTDGIAIFFTWSRHCFACKFRHIFAGPGVAMLLTAGALAQTGGLASPDPVNPSANVNLYVESGIRHSARSVAFSTDGKLIAASSLDRTIKIWDRASGRELATLPNDSMAVAMVFLPDQPTLAAANEDGTIRIWDVATTQLRSVLTCSTKASAAIALSTSHSSLVCGDELSRKLRRWDVRTFQQLTSQPLYIGEKFSDWRLLADGGFILATDRDGRRHLLRTETGLAIASFPAAGARDMSDAAFSAATRQLASVDDFTDVALWDWDAASNAPPKFIRTFPAAGIHAVAFSPDGLELAYASESGDVSIVNAKDGALVRKLGSYANRVENAGLTEESAVLAVQTWYDTHFGLDLKSGEFVRGEAPAITYDSANLFAAEGTLFGRPFIVRKQDDRIEINTPTGELLFTLVILDKLKAWVAVARDGRFDTNLDLSEIKGVHWTIAGKPLEPIPLEILMRDYYEPRLIPKLLRGAELAPLRGLQSLNRLQPQVQIVSVRAGATSNEAIVTVKAASVDDAKQPAGSTHTDVCDLRIFREGQLVARWPEPQDGGDNEITLWRKQSCLPGTIVRDFIVKLPRHSTAREVELSAYAFNVDRVKSETARLRHPLPASQPIGRPRAYVINIGVDGYQAAARNLKFAVRDAEAMASALSRLQDYEVRQVFLISRGTDPRQWRVTKRNIHEVLARLGGSPSRDVDVPGINKLERATPDDLIVISFSGHGGVASDGTFYLLPSDSGATSKFTPAARARFVSSQELAAWIEPIDAGQLIMIIDACHSAGAVEQADFKPGPMGDRGLGQLAYDKGMRILAASQANSSALESERLAQGLLTYALVSEGLRDDGSGHVQADADRNRELTLGEWLRFGVARTPMLYEDIRVGRLPISPTGNDAKLDSRDPIVSGALLAIAEQSQTPVLFDYQRGSLDPTFQIEAGAQP